MNSPTFCLHGKWENTCYHVLACMYVRIFIQVSTSFLHIVLCKKIDNPNICVQNCLLSREGNLQGLWRCIHSLCCSSFSAELFGGVCKTSLHHFVHELNIQLLDEQCTYYILSNMLREYKNIEVNIHMRIVYVLVLCNKHSSKCFLLLIQLFIRS